MILNCGVCKKKLKTFLSRIKVGRGKYCSKKCSNKITLIKKGNSPWNKNLKGIHCSRRTEFKKGMIPWNKGKKGEQKNHNIEGLKLGYGWWKGKKRPEQSGKLHSRWKGGIERLKFLKKRRRALEKNAKGTHTLNEWNKLKEKFNFMCIGCEKFEPIIKLTEDHIIPLSKGGNDYINNIQPLCIKCNSIKHNKLNFSFI